MHLKRSSAIVVLVTCLAACATTGSHHVDWEPVSSERVLKVAMKTVDQYSRQRRSMRAQIKIAAPFLPGKTTSDGVVLAQPIDLMRLDLMDPVGEILVSLNLKLDALELWLPQQGRVYETDSTDESIARLTRLPWTLSEFFALLQGLPPRQFSEDYEEWFVDPDGMATSPDGDAVMSLTPGINLPQEMIRYKNDLHKKVLYQVQFDDYRATNLGMFPHHMTIEFMHPHKVVEMWFENVEWNPVVAWGALAPEYPEGTKVVNVH
ncbi:MAG: hypothetical protein COV45_03550 [Deltaproteobacteria bacterium CG11_big_fil_rev_8_21_14_0_20_47_16]|nr:MAG: hypothetical protein COV45_03550 [Deltaproteobacteria bacterium CG11_big_fil_rev_8_21_14_0_20_47_16]